MDNVLGYTLEYQAGSNIKYFVTTGSQTFLSVSFEKNYMGNTQYIRIKARTSQGWGQYSKRYEFSFQPYGKTDILQTSLDFL